MGDFDDLANEIDSLINGRSSSSVRAQEALPEMNRRIQNNEDRQYVQDICSQLKRLGKGSPHVKIATQDPNFLYVWSYGYQGEIDMQRFTDLARVQHPLSGFKGIVNMRVGQQDHGSPMRVMVKIQRSAGIAPKQEWYDEVDTRAVVVRNQRPRRVQERELSPVREQAMVPYRQKKSRKAKNDGFISKGLDAVSDLLFGD